MRTAVFAVTEQGAELAGRTAQVLDGEVRLFLKEGTGSGRNGEKHFRFLREAVADAFSQYDALVFIMAAGIAVRMIAPHIVSKLSDPAVVVMDEKGLHVISLLSGHIGGANLLTRKLSEALGSDEVITTATDVENVTAIDVLAAEYALRPRPKEEIKTLNSALLDGRSIHCYIDETLPRAGFYLEEFRRHSFPAELAAPDDFSGLEAPAALVTSRSEANRKGILFLIPRRLIAGIGCRRNIRKEQVLEAVQTACCRIGRAPEDISVFASTVVKSREQGLLEAVSSVGKDIRFYENDTLQAVIERYGLQESGFVKETIGVGNVCEAAALAVVSGGKFALTKTKFGPVTVSLVWES